MNKKILAGILLIFVCFIFLKSNASNPPVSENSSDAPTEAASLEDAGNHAAALEEGQNDLVYRDYQDFIVSEGTVELTVALPKDLFKNSKIKIVIWDLTTDEEAASADIDTENTSVFHTKISEKGIYSIYAVSGNGKQQEPINLFEYTTVYHTAEQEEHS